MTHLIPWPEMLGCQQFIFLRRKRPCPLILIQTFTIYHCLRLIHIEIDRDVDKTPCSPSFGCFLESLCWTRNFLIKWLLFATTRLSFKFKQKYWQNIWSFKHVVCSFSYSLLYVLSLFCIILCHYKVEL